MRLLAATLVSLAALAGPAAAERYGATGVTVQHAAVVIQVIPENRTDVDVTVSAGTRLAAPTVSIANGRVVIDGGLRNRLRGCRTNMTGVTQVRVEGEGHVPRDQLPRVTIRTPRTLDLTVGGSSFTTVGASNGGRAAFTGCGDATLAASNGTLDLSLTGSGDVRAEAVTGDLEASMTGSGDLEIASATGAASLRITGSGDLTIGTVGGAVDARMTGSGDLQVGDIGAGARLALTGSGDLETGAVRGSLTAELTGSGGVDVRSVEGATVALRVTSSGSMNVRGGRAERLTVRNDGSGGVRFAGVAGVADLDLRGSGDIYVADAGRVERINDSGSGSINIGR